MATLLWRVIGNELLADSEFYQDGGVALPYTVRYDPDTEEWTASFEGGALYTGSLTGAIVACLDADAHAIREEADKAEDPAT